AGLSLVAQSPESKPQAPGGDAQRGTGALGGAAGRGAQTMADIDWTKQPPVLPKTPAEQLKTFILQPGYRLELVLSDPHIKDPTAIMFDGDGRMFVLEN